MALSNIAREPRREITESAVGLLASIAPLGIVYYVATSMRAHDIAIGAKPEDFGGYLLIAFMMCMLATAGISGFLLLTHWAGEVICDKLARRGLELRPRIRY